MPYDSDRQRRYMHSQHPGIASRWDQEIRDDRKRKGRAVSKNMRYGNGGGVGRRIPEEQLVEKKLVDLSRFAGSFGSGIANRGSKVTSAATGIGRHRSALTDATPSYAARLRRNARQGRIGQGEYVGRRRRGGIVKADLSKGFLTQSVARPIARRAPRALIGGRGSTSGQLVARGGSGARKGNQGVAKIDIARTTALQESFWAKGDNKLARRAFQVGQRVARGPAGQRRLMQDQSMRALEGSERGGAGRAARKRGVTRHDIDRAVFARSDTGRHKGLYKDGKFSFGKGRRWLAPPGASTIVKPLRKKPVGKARDYDPDTSREHRRDMGIGALGLLGAGALTRGGAGAFKTSRALRGAVKASALKKNPKLAAAARRGLLVRPGDLAALGGGTAALGGAGELHRRSLSQRGERWT